MKIYRLLSLSLFLIFISFGTIGGCGNSEINIDGDGIGSNGDSNGNGNGLDPLCEDFINALCERGGECNEQSEFDNCVDFFEVFTSCDSIEVLPDPDQCIEDLDNFDCEALTEDTLLPDSCTPVGVCDICITDEDCPEGLVCSMCFDGLDDLGFPGFDDLDGPPDCTGVVDRCSPFSFFFVDCGDGFF